MKKYAPKLCTAILFAVMLALAVPAHATLITLAPGGTATESNNTLPAGATFQQAQTQAFTATDFSGSETEDVYIDSTGELFVFVVSLNAGSQNGVETISLSDFTGDAVSVGGCSSCAGAGTVVPSGYTRNTNGSVVNVQLIANELNPGQTSTALLIQTNAQSITTGNASFINSFTASVSDLAPGSAVPEPSALGYVLGSMGLLGFGLWKRKKGGAKQLVLS